MLNENKIDGFNLKKCHLDYEVLSENFKNDFNYSNLYNLLKLKWRTSWKFGSVVLELVAGSGEQDTNYKFLLP